MPDTTLELGGAYSPAAGSETLRPPSNDVPPEARSLTRAELRALVVELWEQDRRADVRSRLTELRSTPGTPVERTYDLLLVATVARQEHSFDEALRVLAEAERLLGDPFVDLACTGAIAHIRGCVHTKCGRMSEARVFFEQAWGWYRSVIAGQQRSVNGVSADEFSDIVISLEEIENTLASAPFDCVGMEEGTR